MHSVYHFSFADAWRFALMALFMIACWSMYFYTISILNRMLIAVNEHLPPDKRIKINPFDNWAWHRVRKEYRRLYPDSDLDRRYWIALGAGAISLVCAFYVPWNLLG